MPAFNAQSTISYSIKSIQKQTHKNWELIIIDDNSSDSTLEIVSDFLVDKRVKLLRNSENIGAGASRNKGLENCSGDYIAFCDSDDNWLPHKAELQLNFMQINQYRISFSSYFKQTKKGTYLIKARSCVDFKTLLKNNWLGCLTLMYERELYSQYRFPNIRKRQDWGMWLSIMRGGTLAYSVPEPLAVYNVRPDSLSNSSKTSLISHTWYFYKDYLEFNSVKSFFYLAQYLMIQIKLKINIPKLLPDE